jgi:predicted transcriptional regulator
MNPERRIYNNALNIELIKRLKILSAETNRRQNALIEEAIQDLLKKYESQEQSKKK